MKLRHILALTALLWLYSCSEKPDNALYTDTLPPMYPDYAGVTIPAGIAPLNFAVTDSTADVQRVYITVKGSNCRKRICAKHCVGFLVDKGAY